MVVVVGWCWGVGGRVVCGGGAFNPFNFLIFFFKKKTFLFF